MFYLLLSNVFSQVGGQAKGSMFSAILPFVLIFVIFYFLLIRPQQKQRKKLQEFLSKLKEGDEVITTSGIIGRINKIFDQSIYLEVSNGVEIKILKASVSSSAKDAFLVEKNKK